MVFISSLYKQLKRHDVDGRVAFDEVSGNLTVVGEDLSASAYQVGRIISVNISCDGKDYTTMIHNNKAAYCLFMGLIDGSFFHEKVDGCLQLLRIGSVKHRITPYSVFMTLIGVFTVIVNLLLIVTLWNSRKGDTETPFIAYPALTLFFISIGAVGAYLVWKGVKSTELNVNRFKFAAVNEIPCDDDIQRLFKAVSEDALADAIRFDIDMQRVPELYNSKIGGVPYWDMSLPYPANDNGQKMALLAQFNLSELPENDKLPKSGMLQFFVMPDRTYGYYSNDKTDGYKVVYHRVIDETLTADKVLALDIPTSLELVDLPVLGEFAVNFEKGRVPVSPDDVRFPDIVGNIARDMGISSDSFNAYDLFSDIQIEKLKDNSLRHGLLGYPSFIQLDPRTESEAVIYDVLLLQLDSEFTKNSQRRIMWSDGGAGQFFINSNALSCLDFSNVLYNVDCG